MKITRYVNGKRVDGDFGQKLLVENQAITNAITDVNRRLSQKSEKNSAPNNGNIV
ncbi:MAG: hypothetical protein IJW15_02680 [Clostridia bacterium]|nr:hypothetical protein [Clostridia bacterium]